MLLSKIIYWTNDGDDHRLGKAMHQKLNISTISNADDDATTDHHNNAESNSNNSLNNDDGTMKKNLSKLNEDANGMGGGVGNNKSDVGNAKVDIVAIPLAADLEHMNIAAVSNAMTDQGNVNVKDDEHVNGIPAENAHATKDDGNEGGGDGLDDTKLISSADDDYEKQGGQPATQEVDEQAKGNTATKKIRQPKRINYKPRGIIRLKTYELGARAEFDAFWELECGCFDDYDDLHIGLFRLGAPENTTQSSIISKPLSYPKKNDANQNQQQPTHQSRTHFHTPRIPGHFTLRIFSPSASNVHPVQTLATLAQGVLIVTVNVCEGVKFVIGTLLRKSGGNGHHHNGNSNTSSSVVQMTSQSTSGVINANMVLDGLTTSSSGSCGCERSIYGCVRECGKVVSGVCREYELICVKVAKAQEKEGTESKISDNMEVQTETATTQQSSAPSVSAALKKLLVERSMLERKLVEVHYHYSQIIKKCIQYKLFNVTTLQNLQEQLEGFCPVRELFMTMFRKHAVAKFALNLQTQQQQHHFNLLNPMQPIPCPAPQAISGAVLTLLSDEIVALSRANASAVQEANTVKEAAYKQVCDAVNHVLPGVGVRVFGSSVNGFGSAGSDLDLSLTSTPTAEQLKNLATYIEDEGSNLPLNCMSNLDSSRLTARIPILKFDVNVNVNVPKSNDNSNEHGKHVHVVQVDLSPSNTLAQINTKLLHTYSLHPMASAIMLLLKRLVRKHNVNNPSEGSLSTYAYVLMVIHYLQTVNILPDLQSLAYLRQNDVHGNICNAQIVRPNTPPHVPLQHPHSPHYVCNVYFLCPNNRVEYDALMKLYGSNVSASDVGFHFVNLLNYFVNEFDYRRDVVSITKNDPDFTNYAAAHNNPKNDGNNIPGAYERLAKYAKLLKCEHWPESFTTKHNTLSVVDPLEKFYDVSHVLKNSQWCKIRRVFSEALERLCSYDAGNPGRIADGNGVVQALLGTDESESSS